MTVAANTTKRFSSWDEAAQAVYNGECEPFEAEVVCYNQEFNRDVTYYGVSMNGKQLTLRRQWSNAVYYGVAK